VKSHSLKRKIAARVLYEYEITSFPQKGYHDEVTQNNNIARELYSGM
jgi:hypothetical protein